MASSAGASTMDMAWPLSLVSLSWEKLISLNIDCGNNIPSLYRHLHHQGWPPGLRLESSLCVGRSARTSGVSPHPRDIQVTDHHHQESGDNKILTLQRSKTERYQGDSSGWTEQAERWLQEVDHWVSQEAAGDLLLPHHDDSVGGRWGQQTNFATIEHLLSIIMVLTWSHTRDSYITKS